MFNTPNVFRSCYISLTCIPSSTAGDEGPLPLVAARRACGVLLMGGRHTPGGVSYYTGVKVWLEEQRKRQQSEGKGREGGREHGSDGEEREEGFGKQVSDGGREKTGSSRKGTGRLERAGQGSGHAPSGDEERVAEVWNTGDERAGPRLDLVLPQDGDFRWRELMNPDYVCDIDVLCRAIDELHRL